MRVTDKPISAYPWYLRPFFWNQKRKYGQVLKPALLWARSLFLFLTVALLYGALDRRRSALCCVRWSPFAYPRAPRLRKIQPPWKGDADRIASAFKAEVERVISFRSRLRNQERHDGRGH